jgi:hypothetical protein
VVCSIAAVIDQVDTLEMGLPLADQAKLAEETRLDDYKEEEDKPFNQTRAPTRRQHRDDQH